MSENQKLEARPIKEFPPREYGSSGEAIFDNRVHIRDEKSGRLVKKQHYALHSFGDDRTKLYERPIGSGNMFNALGESIGRWEQDKKNGHWAKVSDKHAEKPLYEMVLQPEDLAQRNSELEAELAALKADLAAKQAPAAVTQKNGKA